MHAAKRLRNGLAARAVSLLLAVLLLGACGERGGAGAAFAVGEPMPAYSAATLDGDRVSLGSLRGDVVLLNVWATWCPPCRDEMPGLQQLHREYAGQGLRVVGVSIDAAGADDEIRGFLREYGIDFTILHDRDEQILKLLGSSGVPETVLLDSDGRVLQRWIGRIDAASPRIRGPLAEALNARTRT